MKRKLGVSGLILCAMMSMGFAQATRPSEKPAELTIVLLSHNKSPAAGVPVVLTDNSVETVYKSTRIRLLSSKPGDIVAKGRSDEKGELAITKIKAGSYAYEVGDPEKSGYANGQFEIKDSEKPKRITITLSEPVK